VVVSHDYNQSVWWDEHVVAVLDLHPLAVRQTKSQRKAILSKRIFQCFDSHRADGNPTVGMVQYHGGLICLPGDS
jgi:hypothetical protein